MDLFDQSTVIGAALAIPAIQAIIGFLRKYNLKGEVMLAIAVVVVVVLNFLYAAFGDSEYGKMVVFSVQSVLAAAGFWRYRNGEETGAVEPFLFFDADCDDEGQPILPEIITNDGDEAIVTETIDTGFDVVEVPAPVEE